MSLEDLTDMLNSGPGLRTGTDTMKISAPISLLNQMSEDFRVSLHRVFKEATRHGFTFYVLGDQHPQAKEFGGFYVETNSSAFGIVNWVGHGIYEPGSTRSSYETRPATPEEIELISAQQIELLEYRTREESDEPIDPEHCDICKAMSEGRDPREAMEEMKNDPETLVLSAEMSREEKDALMENHKGPVFFTNIPEKEPAQIIPIRREEETE